MKATRYNSKCFADFFFLLHVVNLLFLFFQVLEVNGIEMRGKSVNEVCEMLAGMSGTLTFLVVPASSSHPRHRDTNVLHVKAHFDYDPEEDIYIPCRELGIFSFT